MRDMLSLFQLRLGIEFINFLRESEKKASSFLSYRADSLRFLEWLESRPYFPLSLQRLDEELSSYAVILYEANSRRGQLQSLRNATYGLEYFFPQFKGKLAHARQAARGWDRLQPSKSPPPLSKDIVAAIAYRIYRSGQRSVAFAIAVGFLGFFRAAKLVNMRCDDVCFAGDPRLSGLQNPSRAGVVIKNAKTGPDQFVSLPKNALVDKLHGWLHARSDLDSRKGLFHLSYGQLDRTFREALGELGLGKIGYSLHSLRHGGATHEWLSGASVLYIMERGRWRS